MKFTYSQRKMKVVALVALPLVLAGSIVRSRVLLPGDLIGTWETKSDISSYAETFDGYGNYQGVLRFTLANGYVEKIDTYAKYHCEGNTIQGDNVRVYENGHPYCFENGGFCDYDEPKQPFSMTMQFRLWNRMSFVSKDKRSPDSADVLTKIK